ncbi:MAG TPA: phage baseplate assembly protein V [Actinomycetota bacterium]|jgi:phage baseplate assembly protein V
MDVFSRRTAPDGVDGRFNGVAVAIVTNNKDPDGLGRVKVSLPWLGERVESDWTRVVTPVAGAGRGLYWLPEVDDEVLVAFEHGRPDSPYVLGGLWNGKDKPPESNQDGKNNVRALKTRSGHLIRLTDTDGDEKIEIVDKTGKNSIVISAKDKTVAITADADVTVKSTNGKLKLSGNGVEITSQAAVKIEASQNMDLKAGPQLNLKGQMVNIN